jgi:hypothetical protein
MSFSVTAPCLQQQGSEDSEQRGVLLQRAAGSVTVPVIKCMHLCAAQSSMMYALITCRFSKELRIFFWFHDLDKILMKH